MRRNKRTLLLALGVGALVMAGGGAFTASLTTSGGDVGATGNNVVAYGGLDVQGTANVTSLSYTDDYANTGGTAVTGISFTTDADTHSEVAEVAFNSDGTDATACTTTSGGAPTTWTCSITTGSAADGGILVSDITETDITITPHS